MAFWKAVGGWAAAAILGIGAGFAIPAQRAFAENPALLAVQFAPLPDRTEVLIALARPVPFHTDLVATPMPARLEITFDAAGVALGATAGRGFGPVSFFHTEGAEAGRTRYAFDLAQPVTITGVRLKPAAHGKPAYAIVDLAPADAIAMTAASGLVYSPESPPQAAVPSPSQPSRAGPLPLPVGAREAEARPASLRPDGERAAAPGSGVEPARGQAPPPGEGAASETAPPPTKVALAAPAPKPAIPAPSSKHVIVIDPGHGGIDPGAESVAGYHEKEITLATARVLKRELEATGRYKVVLTRDRDVYLKLRERVKRARAARGDLMISLHADSIADSSAGVARGASVYTLSETATDAESERLAQRENRADAIGGVDLKAESDDVAGILVDLTVRETVNGGNRLAGMLVDSMEQGGVTLFPRLPHRSAGFAVLKAPDIPSVLIEMGYLSDIREARGLSDPAYQRRIAHSIAGAIDRYFAWVEASRS